MSALLLAAGVGSRLHPLTTRVAKAAVPFLGAPFAVHVLRQLKREGHGEVAVNLHHHGRALRSTLLAAGGGPSLHFSTEPTVLGTAGALRQAAPMLRDGSPVLVRNCDFLADIDTQALLAAHRSSGARATLVTIEPREGYGRIGLDAAGRVVRMRGQQLSAEPVANEALFTGCHVLDEQVLDRIPAEGPSDIIADVYGDLARAGELHTFRHSGTWWEFGSPRLYLAGLHALLDLGEARLRAVADPDPIHRDQTGTVSWSPGARTDRPIAVGGRSWIGDGASVGAHTEVFDSAILPGASLGADCRLEQSIVCEGVRLPDGTHLDDAVAWVDRPGSFAVRPLDRIGEDTGA